MVANVSILTQTGLRDWLTQRVTAIIIGSYALCVLGFILMHPQVGFFEWQDFFNNSLFRIYSLLALTSIVMHAWIGMWTVSTDYLKPASVRLVFQLSVIVLLSGLFIWGVEILWGIV